MDKLKRYKYIILISLVILGLTFYWYSYRPYHTIKLCINSATDRVNTIRGDQTDMRYFFWRCEKENGLAE